jgi:hypothetical protein
MRFCAIWSLCVSNVDLVTLLVDIEKESDQIDPLPSPTRDSPVSYSFTALPTREHTRQT